MEKLIELHGVKLSWYDFDNETGSDGDEGYFDPELYKESTCFEGEWGGTSGIETDELCDQEFPNRWYYEDFEDEVANELKALLEKKEQEKVEARDRKAKKQQRREEMKAIIRSKLTLEELSFIKFK